MTVKLSCPGHADATLEFDTRAPKLKVDDESLSKRPSATCRLDDDCSPTCPWVFEALKRWKQLK